MYATKTYIGLVTLLLTCNNLVTNEWLPSCNYIYLYCLSTLRFFLSILFGRHVQKNCKVKQIIYDMINFISSFREPFPLSRKTAYNIMSTFLIKISIR